MVHRLHFRAHAKVNLVLEVTGKMSNGYHTLRTVMMRLARLYDDVEVAIDNDGHGIAIICDHPDVPTDERNICHKAARAFFARTGLRGGVTIGLTKRVPSAAGLGGGSSDGAAVLMALNRHYDNALNARDLAEVASGVGKDIPFFLTEQSCAYMEAYGDVVKDVCAAPIAHIVVVHPGIAVSTPEAYKSLAPRIAQLSDPRRLNASTRLWEALTRGDAIAPLLHNDFEQTIFALHPAIGALRDACVRHGASGAAMSGSGSAVFGIFSSDDAAQRAMDALAWQFPSYTVTRG